MALPFIAKPLCQNIGGTPEQYSRDLLLWFLGPAGPEYPTPLSVDASVTLVTISSTGIAVCSKEFRGAHSPARAQEV